jgi:hypothetical protein
MSRKPTYFVLIQLEELDEIFNDPHPVKASLQKRKVAITAQGGMVVLGDA